MGVQTPSEGSESAGSWRACCLELNPAVWNKQKFGADSAGRRRRNRGRFCRRDRKSSAGLYFRHRETSLQFPPQSGFVFMTGNQNLRSFHPGCSVVSKKRGVYTPESEQPSHELGRSSGLYKSGLGCGGWGLFVFSVCCWICSKKLQENGLFLNLISIM